MACDTLVSHMVQHSVEAQAPPVKGATVYTPVPPLALAMDGTASPFSQIIRTHLFIDSYASTLQRSSPCIPPYDGPYSP
jgi:hypothetical protein